MTDQNDKSSERTTASIPTHEAVTLSYGSPDSITGRLLDDRFLIERNLTETGADKGGMGIVYLAQDLKLMGRKVVVKILTKTEIPNPELARKFEHEKESLIRLEHPNVVRLLDAGTLSDGNPFIVLEYIPGSSLRSVMRKTPQLPLDLITHIVESLTNALGAAHANGILHRDVKPENIMLTPQDGVHDLVRLIDFGIARVEKSQLAPVTVMARAIGTPQYMAPEQLIGLPHTPAGDIYSLALVIYEMLVGKPAFDPKTLVELYQMQQAGVETPPSTIRLDISVETEKILMSALEYDPTLRPQDVRSFGSALCRSLRATKESAVKTEQMIPPTQYVPVSMTADGIPPTEYVRAWVTNDAPTYRSEVTLPRHQHIPERTGRNWIKLAVVALVLLAALAIPTALVISNNWTGGLLDKPQNSGSDTDSAKAADPPDQRSLSYFLEVQKMRGGQPVDQPFRSSGAETFESGYKFKLHLRPAAEGFMYLFNEGIAQDAIAYFILYPTPRTNNGSSWVQADQLISTGNNEFKMGRGTEVVWLIWTRERSGDLESVRQAAFDSNGEVKGQESLRMLRSFIQQHSGAASAAVKDAATHEMIIRGAGDVVVHRIELEHK